MNELAKYEVYKKKLEGVCDENGLVASFRSDSYPIALKISTNMGVGEQLSMLAGDDGRIMNQEARLVFTMEDGDVKYQFFGDINIGDALFAKLRNLFRNMTRCWEGFFFREIVGRNLVPEIQLPRDDAGAMAGNEPLEDYDDDDLLEDAVEAASGEGEKMDEETEALYLQAVKEVREVGTASASLLQRRLHIGYAKATKLLDLLEKNKVIGSYNGSGPRTVFGADTPGVGGDGE